MRAPLHMSEPPSGSPAGASTPATVRARRAPLWTALLLAGLFVAAWLPRVWALDAFVTPDERKWLARAANFSIALSEGDLAATFQREHPGVTVMWAGTLGLLQKYPTFPAEAPGPFTWEREHLEAWLAETGGPDPLDLLTAGRWWVVLAVSLATAFSYLPLRRLVGPWPAALAALWIAWDPFAVALSRQLHPDGLVSVLTFLALLTFLAWLYAPRHNPGAPRSWGWLVASALLMGLAWLTKTPAIFLAPAGGLLIAIELRRRDTPAGSWKRLLVAYVLWGALATLTFVALWPAMWVDPIGTLVRMAGEMGEYVERHTNINYFWGAPVDDPGLLFYPVAWLFRTTPAVLLGLGAAAWLARTRHAPLHAAPARRTALALLIFALLFTLGMSLGAKKFDRYILPAFLALDVVAALGWAGVGLALAARVGSAAQRGRRHAALVIGTGAVGVALLHGIFVPIHAPYYLTYFNPLTGGSRTAPFALWVGWGEGLDAAARWLNAQPSHTAAGADPHTAAFYYDGPFSYYYDGAASNLGYGSPLFWLGMDYAVTYINQAQRRIPTPETMAYFESQTPIHTVNFRGFELAKVYDLRGAPLPSFLDIAKERGADFGDVIRLLAYEFDAVQAEPGDRVQATLYLQALAPMERNYNVLMRLVGRDGEEVWRSEGWPWGAPTREWPAREVRPDGHTIDLPAALAPGLYQALVSFYDPETLELLPAVDVDGNPVPGAEQTIATLQVGAPAPTAPAPAVPTSPHSFGGLLALEDASIDGQPAAGELLRLRLLWRSLARTGEDWTVFVHIMGPDAPDGPPIAQQDAPPQAGFAATSLLQPGQRFEDWVEIPLPPGLPAGAYTVRVGLYSGEQRLPVTVGDAAEPSGDFAPATTFTLP